MHSKNIRRHSFAIGDIGDSGGKFDPPSLPAAGRDALDRDVLSTDHCGDSAIATNYLPHRLGHTKLLWTCKVV